MRLIAADPGCAELPTRRSATISDVSFFPSIPEISRRTFGRAKPTPLSLGTEGLPDRTSPTCVSLYRTGELDSSRSTSFIFLNHHEVRQRRPTAGSDVQKLSPCALTISW